MSPTAPVAIRQGPVVPDLEQFRALAAGGALVPVGRALSDDLFTPLGVFLRLDDGDASFLLEGLADGRVAAVGSRPSLVFTARGERCWLRDAAGARPGDGDPRTVLADLLARRAAVALPGLPAFCGGAVGWLGAGAWRWFEPGLAAAPGGHDAPEAVFLFTDTCCVLDRAAATLQVIALADGGADPDAAWTDAVRRIDAVVERLCAPLATCVRPEPDPPHRPPGRSPSSVGEETAARARAAVDAGEVLWLAVPHRRSAESSPDPDPSGLSRLARRTEAGKPVQFVRLGAHAIEGTAAAAWVRRRGETVEAAVAAGSRDLGRTPAEERAGEEDLRSVETPGHVAEVDLARAELGWLAEPGTLETHRLLALRRRNFDVRLDSLVRARLLPGTRSLDVVGARLGSALGLGWPPRAAWRALASAGALPDADVPALSGAFDARGGLEFFACSPRGPAESPGDGTCLLAGGRSWTTEMRRVGPAPGAPREAH